MNNDDQERQAMIANWMVEHAVTLTDVLDIVIKDNGIIGVGLITLADDLKKHIVNKA